MSQSPMPEKNPSAATLKRFQRPSLLISLVGLVLAIVGAFSDWDQFWQSYLLAYMFWLEVALGCLGILMLHHLVGGRWSALIRRVMESGTMTLPLLVLLFVPLTFGLTTLYPWADPAYVAQSGLVQQKLAWLNMPFFLGRAAFYLVVWLGLSLLLNRWSLAEDRTGDPRYATDMRRLSAVGMILYVLTSTFAAYDWMMSLEPEWFSSIYGLLFIAGQGVAALALAILGLAILGLNVLQKEADAGDTWIKSFNDLGNFMLAFVMIWAYFAFSQFLVIWSADIPEEAIWYVHRLQGGWQEVGILLVAAHFVLPFLLLLSRRFKRKVQWLTTLAMLIFVVRLVDLYWLIVPAFYPEGVHIHWLDLVLLLTIGGGWLAVFSHQWASKSPLPLHDPRLNSPHGQPKEGLVAEQRV